MKKILFFLVALSFFSLATRAQLNPASKLSQDSLQKELPAKLLNQFINSLKPAAFESSFENDKNTILKNSKKGNADYVVMGKNISTLAEGIKPSMYKTNFNVQALLTSIKEAKNIEAVTSKLKVLEQGMKPEAFSDVWKMQRNSWVADIGKL